MSERDQLEHAIVALEAQRGLLGDAVVEAALAPMREKLAALSQGDLAPPELHGERRLVTVLFADLADWTGLAGTSDPEAARDLMNSVFAVLVPIIEKYEGTIDKYIGDEIMALFGAPVTHENDAVRALHAVLEMQTALAGFNAAHNTQLGLHYGINTGLVIAGMIGTRGRQEYSVLGDAVNLAARLTAAAEIGQVLVGHDTYRLTAPLFDFEILPGLQIKGKPEPLTAYRLLGPKQFPGSLRGIHGMTTPMVGRDAELARLQTALDALRHGYGAHILIAGEAGLGKSRLVAEARLSLPAGIGWAEGRALSYTHGMSYWVARDLLHRLLGTHPELPAAELGLHLQQRLAELAPEQQATLYPPLARLLDLPLDPPRAHAGAKTGLEHGPQHIREAFMAFMLAWSAHQPLVLVWEDLHWIDPSSWQLLTDLLALTAHHPLVLIGVARPDNEGRTQRAAEGWSGPVIELSPLNQQDSAVLVQNLLHIERLPAQIRSLILAKSEGNPFFLEELIRSLLDAGVIIRAGEQIIATRLISAVEVPNTLQGIIMARIDRLPAADKQILQMAAVIGRIFQRRVLAQILETGRLAGERLGTTLGTLQEHEFIRLMRTENSLDQAYIFKHIITQETAYQSLLLSQRKTLHQQAGAAIELLFADRLDELAATLAYHFSAAEDPTRASGYLLRAGHRARSLGANLEAIDFYQTALTLFKQQHDYAAAARVAMLLGLVYQLALAYEQSRDVYAEGFALWNKAGEAQFNQELQPATQPLHIIGRPPQTLDPGWGNEYWSSLVTLNLFSGLVGLAPAGGFEPELARSWEILDHGRRYVFQLSATAHWSDGQPLTAYDFMYAWRRLLDPKAANQLAVMLYDIRGARAYHQGDPTVQLGLAAPDPTTLIVDLEQPTSHFLTILTTLVTFAVPQHIVEQAGDTWTTERLVTSGPFMLEQSLPQDKIVLVRNPHYQGRSGGNLQRVEYLLRDVSSAVNTELFALYTANQLDLLVMNDVVSPAEIDQVRQRFAQEYVSGPQPFTVMIQLDVTRPPFDDRRVRQALALAIDQQVLINEVMHGYQVPASGGFVPPGIPGHSPQIGLPYDPEQARRLLAEAGYPAGHGFPATRAMTGANRSVIMAYLAAQWQTVLGIELDWQLVERANFFTQVREQQPHMFIMTWTPDYHDADNFLRVAMQQWNRWQNPAFNHLIEQARLTIDQTERLLLLQQADRLLMEEAPIIPLYYSRFHNLIKPWLHISGNLWKNWMIKPHD